MRQEGKIFRINRMMRARRSFLAKIQD